MLLRPTMPAGTWPLTALATPPPPAAPAQKLSSAAMVPFRYPDESTTTDFKSEKLDITRIKILVCDDQELALDVLIGLLSEYLLLGEEHFLSAANLQSALEVFERRQKHIRSVLTDIDMPDPYAGLRLHDELRHYFGFTGPIALMSGRPSNDPAVSAVIAADPETRFFSKPIIDIEPIGDWLRRAWA